jgi:FkbM family methyltransferase
MMKKYFFYLVRKLIGKFFLYSKSYTNSIWLNNLIKRKKIDLIFDVGANTGQYALSLRRFGYFKKIISFEPMKRENEILRERSTKDSNWLVGFDTTSAIFYNEPIGLGSQNKSLKINIAKNSVSSSIKLINKNHTDVEPNSKTNGIEKIKIIKLDKIFNHYFKKKNKVLLKIDTQGYEHEVLVGAINSLKYISIIQLELSLINLYKNQKKWIDIISFLQKRNFKVIKFLEGFEDKKINEILQIDCVLIRKN